LRYWALSDLPQPAQMPSYTGPEHAGHLHARAALGSLSKALASPSTSPSAILTTMTRSFFSFPTFATKRLSERTSSLKVRGRRPTSQ
jgi:hypothetical protein